MIISQKEKELMQDILNLQEVKNIYLSAVKILKTEKDNNKVDSEIAILGDLLKVDEEIVPYTPYNTNQQKYKHFSPKNKLYAKYRKVFFNIDLLPKISKNILIQKHIIRF